ncbi:hypothetical protein [Streptomyces pseudovenezuelae]|uniref:hypothetical protein n=1 Tax=Streptomyces pseudovenezuelae TaxID=67350 RepID=UPI002E7FC2DA|nr:hypothetical protein [Streptomyces pseudovenezuelae]WUA94525.1 hypothetical protein OHO81_44940 [Streptomyces pseudovenezuelae]
MFDTGNDLQAIAYLLHHGGLHTGDQFADAFTMALDVCAAAYAVAEADIPDEFFTDEIASITLIESSPRTMAAIKAISDVLDSTVCETRQPDGTYVPDYIEHVSNWAAAASPVDPKRPPTISEVIGRILRAANHAATQNPAA